MRQIQSLPYLVFAMLAAACGSSSSDSAATSGGTSTGSGGATSSSSSGGSGSTSSGSSGGGGGASSSGSSGGGGGASSSSSSSGAPGSPVNLGAAGTYAVLAKSGVSTVPTSSITGNLGVSPAAATFITGFSLTADATNVFSTSPQVIGQVFAANYAAPTPANLTAAIGDMQLAFTDAAGRPPDATELGAGNVGGMTLAAGVYKWGTGLLIPMDVTLTGSATDVWIFQVGKDLTVSSATNVGLTGGALPKNVFWQVAGLVKVGTTAHVEGIVLCQTSIKLGTGASVNGRLLAQTAVNLDSNAIVEPAP